MSLPFCLWTLLTLFSSVLWNFLLPRCGGDPFRRAFAIGTWDHPSERHNDTFLARNPDSIHRMCNSAPTNLFGHNTDLASLADFSVNTSTKLTCCVHLWSRSFEGLQFPIWSSMFISCCRGEKIVTKSEGDRNPDPKFQKQFELHGKSQKCVQYYTSFIPPDLIEVVVSSCLSYWPFKACQMKNKHLSQKSLGFWWDLYYRSQYSQKS